MFFLPWGIVNNPVWGTFCAAPILVSNPKYVQRVEYLSMATEVPWVRGVRGSTLDMMLRIAAHLVAWRLSQDHESALRPSTNHHWLSRMIIDHRGSFLIVTNHHSLQLITSRHDRFGDAHAAMRRQMHNGVGSVAVRIKNHGALYPGEHRKCSSQGIMFDPSTCAMIETPNGAKTLIVWTKRKLVHGWQKAVL